MKNKNKFTAIIYFVSAILFFTAALIGKNYIYILLGCCCIIFGSKYFSKRHNKTSDKYN